ncbi:MAG: lipopolysaccharide heptosyltransferase I [Phycisphaerae bacterium]|nr:lipopolysaccharide heptosyltransferase I [Phycisphaerae bacterium]
MTALRNLDHHHFRRILIIKPSSLGDVIHALPVLSGLRRRFPEARISWLVSTSCMGLIEGHPELDELIPFDRRRYGKVGRSWKATREFARFALDLRARRFDLVLDLQGLFRSGFFAWISGAGLRMGFTSTREFGWIFHTHRVYVPPRDLHAVERNLLFARRLGLAEEPVRFTLPVQEEARAAVAAMLDPHGIRSGQGYALIAPGTRWETKVWPVEYFAAVARYVRLNHSLPVVLAGAPDELGIADRVQELAGEPVANLAGRTSLQQMVALVDRAAVAIMNDTGPMHLAVALGRPLVAVYGPTNAVRTGPYRRPESVARLDLECSPCYLKRLKDCPHGHKCLKELGPETVCRRVSQALRGRG